MAINVTPVAGLSDQINDVRLRTAALVNDEVLPNEALLWRSPRVEGQSDEIELARRRESLDLREHIRTKVVEAGLWAPHLPKEYGGAGLDFLSLAYMYEILAYAWAALAIWHRGAQLGQREHPR